MKRFAFSVGQTWMVQGSLLHLPLTITIKHADAILVIATSFAWEGGFLFQLLTIWKNSISSYRGHLHRLLPVIQIHIKAWLWLLIFAQKLQHYRHLLALEPGDIVEVKVQKRIKAGPPRR